MTNGIKKPYNDGTQFTPGQTTPVPADKRRLIRIRYPKPTSSGPSGAPTGAPGPSGPFSVGGGTTWSALKRSLTNSNFPIAITPGGGTLTYDDADWTYDTTVTYSIDVTSYSWDWNSTTNQWVLNGGTYTYNCPVTVRKVAATKAQTIDTRIDPRFSTYQLKEFPFQNGLYRGGLFAGYNADGSKVARTYLQFTGLTGPPTAGQQLWAVGGLSLYFTRTTQANRPASIRARFVANDTWDPATLKWSNAPTFKASGADATSLSWTAGTGGKWITLNILPDLEQSFAPTGDGTLSVALSSPNESNGGTSATFPLQADLGWAYFARATYTEAGQTDLGPYLLYAFGGMGTDISYLSVNVPATPTPPALRSNSSSTGTVSVASAAPAGGLVITLSSSNTAQLTVPASVTIPAGQSSATFTVTTSTIPASGSITVSATLGKTVTASVPVAP